jgi:hypothetical protein
MRKTEENMQPKFRKVVIATTTVIAVVASTVALPGSAEARWGWRGGGWGWGWGWGALGVGLGTGLLIAAAARPYYGGYYGYGYPAYSYGGYYRPGGYLGYRIARRVAIHRARWR